MNPIVSDDDVLLALHSLQDVPAPSMAVNAESTLRAGRARRSRRAAFQGGLAVAALTFAGWGAVERGLPLGPLSPASSTTVTQPPRPLVADRVAELAPGVVAAARPVERELADGTRVLDLGITTLGFTEVPAGGWTELPTVLVPAEPDEIAQEAAGYPGPRVDRGVTRRNLVDGALGPFDGETILWSSREPTRSSGDFPASLGYTEGGGAFAEVDTHLYDGVVPRWIPDPRVVIFSIRGYELADGSTTHALEVPTFPSPGDGERLMYFVKIGPEQGFAVTVGVTESAVDATVYLGSDGTVAITGDCRGTIERCAPSLGPDFLDAVTELRTH